MLELGLTNMASPAAHTQACSTVVAVVVVGWWGGARASGGDGGGGGGRPETSRLGMGYNRPRYTAYPFIIQYISNQIV